MSKGKAQNELISHGHNREAGHTEVSSLLRLETIRKSPSRF